jgi:hypothetical protein
MSVPRNPSTDAFDPRLKIIHDLMQKNVTEFFPISTLYGTRIPEFDGKLAERISREYGGLNLGNPTRLTWVSSTEETLGALNVKSLETSQGSMRLNRTREEVDGCLRTIMRRIHRASLHAAAQSGTPGNRMSRAKIAGFVKVVEDMPDEGLIQEVLERRHFAHAYSRGFFPPESGRGQEGFYELRTDFL